MNAFRVRHLENALYTFEQLSFKKLPLDLLLHQYFKLHKKISPVDKVWIKDNFYEVIRWKSLIDHSTPNTKNWTNRLRIYFMSNKWKSLTQNIQLPPHLRCSFPISLYQAIERSLGSSRTLNVCNILNEKPLMFLRVNTNRISRDLLIKYLTNKGIIVEKCKYSPIGLILSQSMKLNDLPEYTQGQIETQDESSQVVAHRIPIKPGNKVLDFCAGSGGKSIIFANLLQGKGKIYLHDIRNSILKQSKLRFKKAGIKNYQILKADDKYFKTFENKMDWVIVDVPCSGTGNIRRSPDLKWSFNDDWLEKVINKQREIFKQAINFMKSNGKIVYITSSILNQENEDQVNYFCNNYNMVLDEEPFQSLPQSKGMDGYFSATLKFAIEGKIKQETN